MDDGYLFDEIPHLVRNDNTPSLWALIRNLNLHPDEIPHQVRNDDPISGR